MKKPSLFNWLARSMSGKVLASLAVFWLIFPPQVFALDQIVNKYVTTYSVTNTAGRGDWGFVFNFNNAKSNGGTEADISETACIPESTLFNFGTGPDGFTMARLTGTRTALTYVGGTDTALQARLTRQSVSETYRLERRFFYDCGTPTGVSFSIDYQVKKWTVAGATNNFTVVLIKPDNTSITLVPTVTLTGIVGWTNVAGTIAASDLTQSGTYRIQINGAISTGAGTVEVVVQYGAVNLAKTSQYTDYRKEVEFMIKAAPYSSLGSGAYTMEIRAKKADAASDNVAVEVWNGSGWTTRTTITNTAYSHATDPDYTFTLSNAEYNNGLVRVRYVDTNTTGDNTGGGIKIDYHRIKVDQGVCVDFIQSVEADCGKCHNYGGDITKPWPNTAMHNQHAQSETVADCKWCHPDFTANGTAYNMSHSDGVVTIAGTKIWGTNSAGFSPGNLSGANGTYNGATTKTCLNSACHYNQTTPAWNAVFATSGFNGTTIIARNCSRCHKYGAGAADSASDLNVAMSWPTTKAHAAHDTAYKFDEYSCQSNGSCHPDNRTVHSIVGEWATNGSAEVKMAPNYNSPTGGTLKYIKIATALPNDGNGRCYNTTCHGGQETPKWNLALPDAGSAINVATECTKCHVNELAQTWTQGWATSAKQYNSSITGLHRGVAPTSEKSHVGEYGCNVCHNGEPALHFKTAGGTTGLDTYLPVERPPASNFWATIGYVAGAGAVPDYTGGTQAPSCATTSTACHAEGSTYKTTTSTWAREWSWRAYSDNELDRCQVCHGHWGSFKAGVKEPHYSSNSNPSVLSNLRDKHTDSGNNCGTMCHATAWATAGYTHGVAATATTKTMDINSNAGFTDLGTYVGCTACHVANDGVGAGKHGFVDAVWKTRVMVNGPGVTCNSAACHGGDNATVGNVNYWPGGSGTSYPDRPGEHNAHIQALAAKLGYPFTSALTDQQQKTMCAYCHTYSSYPGEGGHADNVAPATLTSPTSFNPMWSTFTANYPVTPDNTGVSASYTGGNGVGGSCSGIDCHNNKATSAANEWYDGSSPGCLLCHSDAPNQTTHLAHTNAAGTYGITITCANCHGGGMVWGTPGTKPTTGIWGTSHINGTFTVSGGTTTFTYSGATYPTVKGSCGTNNCHRSDASANTAPVVGSYPWGTTGLTGACNFCHLEAMTTSDHAAHFSSNSMPAAPVNECYVCHAATSNSSGLAFGTAHMNAADDVHFWSTVSYENLTAARAGSGTTATCSNIKCHNGITTPTWTGSVSCGSCHNGGGTDPRPIWATSTVAGKHAVHANNDTNYADCANCHANATSYTATGGHANHQNLTVNVSMTGMTYADAANTAGGVNYNAAGATHLDDGTCTNTSGCHGTTGSQTWGTASTLTNGCKSCHGNDNATVGNVNYWPAAGVSYPKRGGEHDIHVQRIAQKLGYPYTNAMTDAQQKTICSFCHGNGAGQFRVHADFTGPASVWGTAFNPLWSTVTGSPLVATTADSIGAAAAYNAGTGTCSGIDCHNNQTTTASFAWFTSGTSTCLMCHALGGTGANPTTGLHNITVGGPQHHDDGITGGCGACHVMPAIAPASTHINNGTFVADSLTNNDRGISRAGMTYTQVTPSAGLSGTCAGTGGLAACHSDGGNWSRQWSTAANSTATAPASARCNVCHGQWSAIAGSTGWATGTSHFKAGGLNVSTNTRGSGHDTTTCDTCHAYGAAGNGRHNVVTRQINLNNNGATPGRTGNTYGSSTAGCGSCHGTQTDPAYNFPISYFGTAYVSGTAFPLPSCSSCHTAGSGGAPIVKIGTTAGSSSGHTDADGPGGTYTINTAGATAKCENCHSGHASGTTGPGDVEITTWSTSLGATVPTMNYPYVSHGRRIQLGNAAGVDRATTMSATATTEAQMCWSCHDNATVAVSEWGTNQDAKTGNSTYNFGDLYTTISDSPGVKQTTSNWTTGFWRSGKGVTSTLPYWYKRGSIQSTHSVNFDSGTVALTTTGNSLGFGRKESKDTVQNIRCSYCHDVHGTHNGVNGDTPGTGTADAPYLRGTWRTNPYAEDGAPQLNQANWSVQGGYNSVPRAAAAPANTGTTAVDRAGGFWIDQNSANPTSGLTATGTSGLCEQCHGTNKNGTWATAALGSLNWSTNGTGEANIWVSGYNGHANSVLNGPGRSNAGSAESYARNIFTRTKRGTNRANLASATSHGSVDMGVASNSGTSAYSYRGGDSSYQVDPNITRTAFKGFSWGTPVSAPTGQTWKWAAGTQALTFSTAAVEPWATMNAQANYHTFTCSKCHTPHASRLPKLMITNCLDTNHNTWEDNTTFVVTGTLPAPWANTRHSQFASAQNCHRLDARASLTSGQLITLGLGWNRVTPWLEFTSPNSTRSNTTPNITPQ